MPPPENFIATAVAAGWTVPSPARCTVSSTSTQPASRATRTGWAKSVIRSPPFACANTCAVAVVSEVTRTSWPYMYAICNAYASFTALVASANGEPVTGSAETGSTGNNTNATLAPTTSAAQLVPATHRRNQALERTQSPKTAVRQTYGRVKDLKEISKPTARTTPKSTPCPRHHGPGPTAVVTALRTCDKHLRVAYLSRWRTTSRCFPAIQLGGSAAGCRDVVSAPAPRF